MKNKKTLLSCRKLVLVKGAMMGVKVKVNEGE